MLNTKKVCIFVLNKLNHKLKMKSVILLLFLSTTLFSQSDSSLIQSDTNFIYTSQKIIIGTSGTTTWVWCDSTLYIDTIPAIFLVTSFDSVWVNINLTYSSDKPELLTDLIYREPNYQRIEQLSTRAVRGYIVRNAYGFSFSDEKYLDKDKKPFPKLTIVWQVRR